jgi:predicted transcriptional regulator
MTELWTDRRVLLEVRIFDLSCGYTVKDIAEMLGEDESTIRKILRTKPYWWDDENIYRKVNDLIVPHALSRGRGIYDDACGELLKRRNKEKILIRTKQHQERTP